MVRIKMPSDWDPRRRFPREGEMPSDWDPRRRFPRSEVGKPGQMPKGPRDLGPEVAGDDIPGKRKPEFADKGVPLTPTQRETVKGPFIPLKERS